jgi:hypothetical protein
MLNHSWRLPANMVETKLAFGRIYLSGAAASFPGQQTMKSNALLRKRRLSISQSRRRNYDVVFEVKHF